MACHPSSILVWVKDLSISGSNWKENFAWSCMRMGIRIINGEWWQDAKINYEGYWNNMASFDWQKLSQNDLFFPFAVCFSVIWGHIHSEICVSIEAMSSYLSLWSGKDCLSVYVTPLNPVTRRPWAPICFFWLLAGCCLCHLSRCDCLSILAMTSPNYSCFQCYPFEIYDHKDSGLEARGTEASICARDLLSLF